MIQQTQVVVWFLLCGLLSICSSSSPPLSTIHKINTAGRLREQIINTEDVNERGRQLDHDTEHEMTVAPRSTLYFFTWKDVDVGNGSYVPLSGKEVNTHKNTDNVDPMPAVSTNTSTSVPPTKTTATTITIPTTTVLYPVDPTPGNPSPASSSCSSPGCKWLASWHFIAVVCMTVTWLVVLLTLYFMTRTARGRLFLETCSSMCIPDKKEKEEDKVLAKGIGYFDGSPGLRRFVLIEDEDDDEEEDDLFVSDFKEEKNKEDKETEKEGQGQNRTSKRWKPPRKGTYILQEASKKDVLEVGTYRLDEEEEEEAEAEVDGKKKEGKEDGVQYILEGATYILKSERVEREGIGGTGYGQIGGIEGLYGVTGREGLRGYGRVEGLEGVYGIMGRGVGDRRFGRIGGIEILCGILQEGGIGEGYRKVVEVGGKGGEKRGEDGVLLSVTELDEAVGEKKRVRDKSTGGGRITGQYVEWREVGGRGTIGIQQREGGGETNKQGVEGKESEGKEVDERCIEEGSGIEDRWGVRIEWGGVRPKWGRIRDEGMWGRASPSSCKRAASFPMDHFLSSQLMPRKLSLIQEEENL